MIRPIVSIAAAAFAFAAPASAVQYFAVLNGAQEVPAVATDATGRGFVEITGSSMSVRLHWYDITAPLTMGHIHCCSPRGANSGVAVNFMPLPPGLTGSFTGVFDLDSASTYAGGFLTASGGTAAGAKARLLAAFDNGTAYFNIHNAPFRAGEIRGQIAAVPEPATWAMMILGFGAVGVAMRRRPVARVAG